MNNKEYEQKRAECWIEFCREHPIETPSMAIGEAFCAAFDRAYALGKQEKDAKKKPALTDKEVYAIESAISELESLMDGTLDEDYHQEQKSIISALKRIIKKYEKK